jgi:hypothetical protein
LISIERKIQELFDKAFDLCSAVEMIISYQREYLEGRAQIERKAIEAQMRRELAEQ